MGILVYSPNSSQIEIEIPDNSYLLDVAMPTSKLWRQVLLTSPTGSGKTTFLLTLPKVILAVPTQDLARQLQSDGLNAIMEGVTAAHLPECSQYVSTYDSLPRLVDELVARDEKLAEWTLAIDEVHHILSDASPAFRLRAISSMLDVATRFGRVIGMTGTPPDIPIPCFEDAQLVKFTKQRDPIPLYLVEGDSAKEMLDLMINKLGYQKVITHMDDKSKGEETAKELELLKISTFLFNATTKEEEYHTQMLELGQLPEGCQVLITTTLYNDGYSFTENEKYAVLIANESRLTPEEVEQVCNRIRGNPPSAVFWMKRKHNLRIEPFDYQEIEEELRSSCLVDQQDAQAIVDILTMIYERNGKKKDELIKASTRVLRDHLKHLKLVEHEDGRLSVEIDDCWLANTIYERWRTACNHSSGLMIQTLQNRYGYKFIKIIDASPKASPEEIERRTEAKRMKKEQRQQVYSQTVGTLRSQKNEAASWALAVNIKKGHVQASREEKEIAITTLRLTDMGMSIQSALDVIESSKPQTPNALAVITQTARMARLRHLITQDVIGPRQHIRVNPIVNFLTMIMGGYQVGAVVEEKNLEQVFAIASDRCPFMGRKYDSHRKRMALLKQCYRIERDNVKTAKGRRKRPVIKDKYPFDPTVKIDWSSYANGEEQELIEGFL